MEVSEARPATAGQTKVYVVQRGEYYPMRVDTIWQFEPDALKRANELNRKEPDGCAWVATEVVVRR